MRKFLLISLSWWLAATALAATNPAPLTAAELLDRFAATQDALLKSCAFTVNTDMEWWSGPRATRTDFVRAEIRMDATRTDRREHEWGDRFVPRQISVAGAKNGYLAFPREKAEYTHYLWTRQTIFIYQFWDTPFWPTYREMDPRRGSLRIGPPASLALGTAVATPSGQRRAALRLPEAGHVFGYFFGEDRCDDLLRKLPELRVRNRLEPVNEVPCWVVEARQLDNRGEKRYRVWLDPAHGYHIARADIQSESRGGATSRRGEFRLRVTEFNQSDGVWAPVKVEAEQVQPGTAPGSTETIRVRSRIEAMRVNPDHDALKSFALDDIREGAGVWILGNGEVRGVWQGGRAVDSQGNVLFDSGLKNTILDKTTPAGKK